MLIKSRFQRHVRLALALVIGVAVAAISAGATATSGHASDKVDVVATFSILADIADEVGGDLVEVATLVPRDGDTHTFQPTPTHSRLLKDAELIVENGAGLEGWLERLIRASGTRARRVTTTNGLHLRRIPLEEAERSHRHVVSTLGASSGSVPQRAGLRLKPSDLVADPHAWLVPHNAIHYANAVRDGLCAVDPDDCPTYRRNASLYAARLGLLHREIEELITASTSLPATIVTSHDAFGYFGDTYRLRIISAVGLSTEAEPAAADMARIIQEIRSGEARALFLENLRSQRIAEQIARETGLRPGGVLYADSLSKEGGPAADYISMMRHNARTIATALSAAPAVAGR